MKKKWKQIASFLLAAALLLGIIPALSVTTNAEANSGIRGATSANAGGVYLSDLEWVSAKHYNDAHGAAFGVQKNHCSEYPWYCDTPGDPSTEQARYPGSGIYMNGDTTAPVLFEKCLGVAPDATIIYDISGLNAVKFESDIGVEFTKLEPWKQTGGDVETNTKGRCQFEIYADGVQIYRSELLNPTNGRHISVDIPKGTKELKLVNKAYGSATGNDPNTNFASDSEWGNPLLVLEKDTEELILSDMEWVSAKHYNDAHGAAFGVQKNHCSEYPWYCDTPGDPSTEQARYPGSGIYMNGDTTTPVLFEKCLGVAPDATIIYDISGLNAVKFDSDIGVEFTKLGPWQQQGGSENTVYGRCQFEIYADGVQIYKSELLNPTNGRHISVDIPEGTKELKLVNKAYGSATGNDPNTNFASDSEWGNPTLTVRKSSKTWKYLSDMDWTSQLSFYNRISLDYTAYGVQKDRIPQYSFYLNKLDELPTFSTYINGKSKIYQKGLGMKPDSYAIYDITGMNAEKLTADIGICDYWYDQYMEHKAKLDTDPTAIEEHAAQFIVYADGVPVYQTGADELVYPDSSRHIEVDIPSGTKTLKLECRNYWYAMTGSQLSTGDDRNYGSNDAMWGDAKLIFGSGSEEPELPDAPELGENELWLSEQTSIYDYMEGKDPLKKDGKMTLRDADGKKQIYVKGLTGNAKAFATYDIAGMGVTMLKAEIGVDAVMNNIGQTVFTVEADGKPVYTSKEMNAADPAEHIEVVIPKGTERLTIYAVDAKSPSRAIWANAILVVDKSTAVTPQPKPELRRVVNAENPLYLIGYYVYTMETIYEQSDPGYSVKAAWDAVPDELKPYTMMVILSATNGYDRPGAEKMVGGGNQYCPYVTAAEAAENAIRQCQENNIPCAFQVHGGECTYELGYSFEFLEHLAQTYSCLQGFTAAEMYNYPRHNGLLSPNAYLYEAAEIAVDNGMLFIWTDTNKEFAIDAESDTTLRPGGLFQYCLESSPAMARLFRENKENIILMYKESMARSVTDSMLLGLWLSEYCGNWGISSDWWHWESEQLGKPFWVTTGDTDYIFQNYWRLCLSMPSNLHTMSIARAAGYGATCFLNEAGYATQAINGKRIPTYQYSIAPMMSRLVKGEIQIASREEVKEACRAVIVDSANWYNVNIDRNTSRLYYTTGKYGIVPVVPTSCPQSELEGYDLVVRENLGSAEALKAELDKVYTQEYTGDAWANHSGKSWYVMNYAENKQADMRADFDLTAGKFNRASVTLGNHAFAVLTEGEKEIRVDLSNHRYDCTEIWESDDWKTGGGNIGIVRVLQVLDDLADNMAADTNPDHELRMSVIVLDMDKEPQITFEDSAYIRKLMNYTVEKTGEHEWTITVEHNGFVSFTVTREDDAAEPDEPVVPPVPVHPAPVSRPTQTKPAYDFADVRSGVWYYGDVMYAAENGLMNGTSGSTFSPLENLTRAQLTAVLYRMDGSPAVSGTCSFTDAKRGAYYADALVWAERNALVNGYGSGAFGVGDAITREQLVTILYRYAAYKGIDVSARADLSGYRDAEKISGYARDAFGWAVEAGLICGSGDLLNPQGRTTRAEYAAIAARFHKTFIAK